MQTYLQAIHYRGKWYTIAEASALAIKQQNRQNFQVAVDIFDLILAKLPEHAPTYFSRGVALHNMRRFDEGLSSYDKAIAHKPDYAEAYFHRGITFDNMQRFDDALTNYNKAIALKPDYAEAYYRRGKVFVYKGDMQEAERMYLKALALKPDLLGALISLTDIRKYQDAGHADITKIKNLLGKPNLSLGNKGDLYFSLGKIYDDCGLYDEAFESYWKANQIANSIFSYNAKESAKLTKDILNVFTKDFLARSFACASEDQSPVFVVGMPRSGTTLIASILSNHPSIATAGELENVIKFTQDLPVLAEDGTPYPEAVKSITPALATRLIQDYLKRLRRDVDADITYVIDKTPINFRHLGFIGMLFPKSHVIHCTRNPLDTGLSNYFQRFSSNCDYSFDLGNIGHFYGEYKTLMEHWRKVLPLKMIEISYEEMVGNTDKTARESLDFLGLEWDERCLAPHKNPCEVGTSSSWQVRQPIYRHSVERWRSYEKHLTPLQEALGLL